MSQQQLILHRQKQNSYSIIFYLQVIYISHGLTQQIICLFYLEVLFSFSLTFYIFTTLCLDLNLFYLFQLIHLYSFYLRTHVFLQCWKFFSHISSNICSVPIYFLFLQFLLDIWHNLLFQPLCLLISLSIFHLFSIFCTVYFFICII